MTKDRAGKVTPVTARPARKPVWPTGTTVAKAWPSPGQATLTVDTTRRRAGQLPLTLRAANATTSSTATTVRLWPRPAGNALGRGADSIVVSLSGALQTPIQLDLDAAAAASNTGGDWLTRTSLVQLTGCRVTSTSITGCTGTKHLATKNDGHGHLTTTLPATPSTTTTQTMQPMVVATATSSSGPAGSYAATPLAAASSWSGGGQSGSFSWNQQLALPPVPGDLAPPVTVGYDSGSVDGRVSASNNQPSWLGDGFDLDPSGYIERRYVPCSQDMTGGNNTVSTSDNCWKSDNATISIAGHSGPLVKDKTSATWKLYEDDGTRFAHYGTLGAAGEYWTMTTQDGTVYTFGKGTPAVGTGATNSAWAAPVFGNQSGEPCYVAGNYAGSVCPNAVWRWNLDSIVDIHGNAVSFKYATETNNYGENNNHTVVTYTRGGYLTEMDYGQRTDAPTALPVGKVLFSTAERCITDSTFTNCAASNLTASTASHWPDVPFDQICTAATGTVTAPTTGGCVNVQAPAFFTRIRLTGVTTQIVSGTTYTDVDSWAFTQKFLDPGDGTSKLLWTSTMARTGKVGATLATPTVTFVPSSTPTPNRVDAVGDGAPAIYRYRISWIDNGQGGTTTVGFTGQDCTATDKPTDPANNTRRCFPAQYLVPNQVTPTLNWFNKYLVSRVVTTDAVASQPSVTTSYQYVGAPAWHFDRDDLTPQKLRTWGQWRGYGSVRTFVGASPGPWSASEDTFMRGMDHDCLTTACTTFKSVSVTDSRGGTISDADQDNGFTRESRQYASGTPTLDSSGNVTSSTVGATLSETLNTPLLGAVTADDGTRQARLRVLSAASTRSYRADATYLETNDSTTYDAYGQPTQEESATAEAGTTCTRTTYANDTAHWIHVAETSRETVSVPCATTPNRATDIVSADRTLYDGATTWSATPTLTKGDATTHQAMTRWDTTTNTGVYQTTSTVTYDALGRTTSTADGLGNKSTTAFTPATGGPVTGQTVTDAATHTVKTTLQPARGLVLTSTDNNGNVTTNAYDALGELTGIWLPGRATTSTASRTFTYTFGTPTTPSVVKASVLQNSGSYTTSATYYDGQLRPVEVQTPSADTLTGARLVTQTIYNERGLKSIDYGPVKDTTGTPGTGLVAVNDGSVPSRTDYTYDAAGRLTKTAVRSGAGSTLWHTVTTTTAYNGDATTTTPPAGGTPTTTFVDSRGNTVKLRQYTTSSGTAGAYQDTTYTHRADGLLSSMKDPAGNTWSRSYDLFGRVTSATDPDSGTTTTTYDAAGHVQTVQDARGSILWFGYDALGRKTAERKTSSTGTQLAGWTYDTATAGVGKPASSTRYDASGNAYTRSVTGYNNWGQPTGTSLSIPTSETGLAGTYTTTIRYNLDGQIKNYLQPTIPGVAAVSQNPGYDGLGAPGSLIAQTATVVAGTTRSAYGQALQVTLGPLNNSVYSNYTYADGTRRLTNVKVTRDKGTGYLANTSYTQDDFGNLTKVTDAPTDPGAPSTSVDTQCFNYDPLQHLTRAWTPASADCAAAPTVAGLGGPAPYWTDWTYNNATAVRTGQTVHASTGDTTTTYASPAAGAVRPHSLTSRTTGTATTSYGYDASGDLTSQSGAAGAATYTWDDELRLASSTGAAGATSRVYDADGNLLVSRDPAGKTLFADDTTEVRYTTSGGTLHVTHHYTFEGRPVATQTDAGALTFLVTDPHSTATMSLSDTTNTVTASRRFDPFGNARGTAAGTWPDTRGFLNAPKDATTGLTHLGARDYDPVLGRFISVDPELDLSDPTQWNAYGYANSNPVTLSDPSGRRPEGSGDYGCSNCAMVGGSWHFGNETAGSTSVRGGTYHQSYAAAQTEQTYKVHKKEEQHRAEAGDNVLAREEQARQVAAAKRAQLVRSRAAQAEAEARSGSTKHASLLSVRTVGLCGNLNFVGGVGPGGTLCGGWSGWTPFVAVTAAGEMGVPSASGTVGLMVSNARRPSDLSGWGGNMGFSVGEFAVGGGDVGITKASDGSVIWTAQGNAGVGLLPPDGLPPWEIHGGGGYTWTTPDR
ncbi:RHS repeat-associated core domain-containing protein [Phycicoccus sp. M110.8]|uniref:RHS repeat domain-containing protein n=1 Tax=Phycicoccus sp. M110.8 TaxID=3075433 RepID=UPI0028FD4B01|nr:RHS repeat-associated core domain-containing protein [Phycicoccus sp. M110.8]MDU0314110.1 RHS repeat-associated core domain-containing protein [Phycicoccus sp. M110.8]